MKKILLLLFMLMGTMSLVSAATTTIWEGSQEIQWEVEPATTLSLEMSSCGITAGTTVTVYYDLVAGAFYHSAKFMDFAWVPLADQFDGLDGTPFSIDITQAIVNQCNNAGGQIQIGGHGITATKVTLTDPFKVTISEAGYATFSVADDVMIPAGVDAFYATASGSGTVTLKKIEEMIKGGQGVILKGSADTYAFEPTTGADAPEINLLKANLEDTDVSTLSGGNAYILNYDSARDPMVQFNKSEEGILAAGKAYLWIAEEGGNAPAYINITFADTEGSETGIKTINSQDASNGLYFNNGSLVIVKNGVKYNEAGQEVKK